MSQRTLETFTRVALLTALTLSVPHATRAQEDSYDAVIQEALDEYRQEMWEEARTLFHRAHQLRPSARTWFGIGTSSFQAQRYVESVRAFEAALADTRKPLTEKMRAEASSTLVRARRFVGELELRITPAAATPVVTIDGVETDASQPVVLVDPGRREVVVKAEGYATLERDLRVDGGTKYTLELELQPAGGKLAARKRSDGPLKPERKPALEEEGGSAWPWIGLAASGAVAIGGGVVLVLGLRDVDAVENPEPGTRWEDIRDEKDRAPVLTALGAAMLGVGLAGAGLSTFLLLGSEDASAPSASVSLLPNGVVLRGQL